MASRQAWRASRSWRLHRGPLGWDGDDASRGRRHMRVGKRRAWTGLSDGVSATRGHVGDEDLPEHNLGTDPFAITPTTFETDPTQIAATVIFELISITVNDEQHYLPFPATPLQCSLTGESERGRRSLIIISRHFKRRGAKLVTSLGLHCFLFTWSY